MTNKQALIEFATTISNYCLEREIECKDSGCIFWYKDHNFECGGYCVLCPLPEGPFVVNEPLGWRVDLIRDKVNG